jgi:dTDP-4-dehydrorhamnose 3,5-epimerase
VQIIIDKIPSDVEISDTLNFKDIRGELNCIAESFNPISANGFSWKYSKSKIGVARGLHWQNLISPQEKIIHVSSGNILDILLNMDPASCDYGKCYRFNISSESQKVFRIPSHYAHGFVALTDVEFMYLCLGKYDEDNEMVINMIEWLPNTLNLDNIVMSEKDRIAKFFNTKAH